MCDTAYDRNDVENHDLLRAKKPHVCDGCDRTIRVGHLYTKTAVLYDGSWSSWKHCGRCNQLMSELHERLDRDTVVDPHFNCGSSWEDAFGEPPPEHVQVLAILTEAEASCLLEAKYATQQRERLERRLFQALVRVEEWSGVMGEADARLVVCVPGWNPDRRFEVRSWYQPKGIDMTGVEYLFAHLTLGLREDKDPSVYMRFTKWRRE